MSRCDLSALAYLFARGYGFEPGLGHDALVELAAHLAGVLPLGLRVAVARQRPQRPLPLLEPPREALHRGLRPLLFFVLPPLQLALLLAAQLPEHVLELATEHIPRFGKHLAPTTAPTAAIAFRTPRLRLLCHSLFKSN